MPVPDPMRPLEIWGGIESTVNRVGDQYFDQIARTGHDKRPADLDLFASLGISAIRYPVLWERTAPRGLATADWSWPDGRLQRLRELGLRPIVGLVHHGGGPRFTNLLDPAFPEKLAAFAGAVAARYPWVTDYTPVNEPLTTARFACLYGHWYPHHRNDLSFAQALINQCRAIILAMRAIRSVNSSARLIQTEDLGKTYATPSLQFQADYENERRWSSYDLLSGTLTPSKPMWGWLRFVGVPESELQWFLDNPCPPDIFGFNTYLTSQRFLDDNLSRYPIASIGADGPVKYVDVEAVRALPQGMAGTESLLLEAWQRYRKPIAVTEVHNSCSSDEQLRWLYEIWTSSLRARAAGADVRAVTAWAMLGLYDWHCLVTRLEGRYEPGVFDIRTSPPLATPLVQMIRDLALSGRHHHPALNEPGWWRQPARLLYRQTYSLFDEASPESGTPVLESSLILEGVGASY